MTDNHLLLYRLAELMLEHEQHILPVDLLFDDEQIGDFVKSIQIDSPYQQMLLEGVLTESVRDEKLYVSFTVEGYFHHVLGEIIYDKLTEGPPGYLFELIQTNKLNGVHEGVSNCLMCEVTNGVYNSLLDLIETTTSDDSFYIKPLAIYFSEGDINLFIDALINNDRDQNYALILKALNYLYQNNKHRSINKFWNAYSTKIKQVDFLNSSFHKATLQVKGLIHYDDQKTLEYLIHSISTNTELTFNSCSFSERQIIFLELNNVLVSKGLLKNAFIFSSYIGLYKFSESLLTDNYYNVLYPLLELGEFEQAELIYQRCLKFNQHNGYFINWSGWIYQAWYELKSNNKAHLEQGIELYEKATKLIEKNYGKYSIHKYQNLENLGYAYSLSGEYEKSLHYLDQAIVILQKSYQTDTAYLLGNPYEMKAVALNSLGKYEEALQFSFKSDKCKLLQISNDSPEMAWNFYDRAKIYHNMGKIDEARLSLNRALKIRELSLGKQNILTIQTKKEFDKLYL